MKNGKTTQAGSLLRYRASLLIVCALLFLTLLVGNPLRAHAASTAASVTCWGDWCSGKDPNDTGCAANATTLTSVDVTDNDDRRTGKLEVRWSPTCKTKWARLNLWSQMNISGFIATQSGGYQQEKYTHTWRAGWQSPPGYYYTYMIYSPSLPVYAHLDQINTCNVCATPWA